MVMVYTLADVIAAIAIISILVIGLIIFICYKIVDFFKNLKKGDNK